jgi:hypothetical protein
MRFTATAGRGFEMGLSGAACAKRTGSWRSPGPLDAIGAQQLMTSEEH